MEVPGHRVVRLLGYGDIAEVHQAVGPGGEPVAIKVLVPGLADDPRGARWFAREIDAVVRIAHPGVVTVRGRGTLPDGRPFAVLELIEGVELRREIPLAAERLIAVARQLAATLAAAHAAGEIHGNLHTGHVHLLRDGRTKLLGFGAPRVGEHGALMGNPTYLAPELVLDGKVDHRADVYGLGFVLYECASGALPYPYDVLQDFLRRRDPPPSLARKIPRHLDLLLRQMLAFDPGHRPQTAAEVLARLDVDGRGLPTARLLR